MPGKCRASSLYSFNRTDSCKTASLLPLPHIVTNAVSFVDGLMYNSNVEKNNRYDAVIEMSPPPQGA